MKKINFKKLQLPIGLKGLRDGNYNEVDIAEDIADIIYMQTSGIRNKRLAEKIFDSEGEIELDDDEVNLLNQFINSNDTLLLNVRDGIDLVINNQNKKEDEKGRD